MPMKESKEVKLFEWGGLCGRCLSDREVMGMNEGADQKLRGRWDARSSRTCVTVLHNSLFRQKGSGSEVKNMCTLFEYALILSSHCQTILA